MTGCPVDGECEMLTHCERCEAGGNDHECGWHGPKHPKADCPDNQPACGTCLDTGEVEMYPGGRADGNYWLHCDDCKRDSKSRMALR